MAIRVRSYEERVASIHTVSDVGKQIDAALKKLRAIKKGLRKANEPERVEQHNAALKKAESVLRKLRANAGELEEQMRAKNTFRPTTDGITGFL